MYRSNTLRSTLNTGSLGLDMCKVCIEAVHCVALWTRVTSGLDVSSMQKKTNKAKNAFRTTADCGPCSNYTSHIYLDKEKDRSLQHSLFLGTNISGKDTIIWRGLLSTFVGRMLCKKYFYLIRSSFLDEKMGLFFKESLTLCNINFFPQSTSFFL